MADYIGNDQKYIPTKNIGMEIESMITNFANQRKIFERKWYDNNFFDDGYHFRYMSRSTGKIVDLTEKGTSNTPQRAIPKASRQIRGLANLLLSPSYLPVVYPDRVVKRMFGDNEEEYQAAVELSKDIAKKTGIWLEEEWKNQEIWEKVILMCLLTAKHGVSYLLVWPDANEEKLRSRVADAFEVYCMGSIKDLEDSPAVILTNPELIDKIKSNDKFDMGQRELLLPDNKYATSELKEAYSKSRYGTSEGSDAGPTLILKETFKKEYLTQSNFEYISQMFPDVISNKKPGDIVMRHVYSAAGIWLLDEYLDIDKYPIVDLRFEPGPMYQTALMERFIPSNKVLDMVVARVEKYINTMVTGTWVTRKGENFEITNIPGGQKLEYTTTPPTQGQMAPVPPFVFNFIGLLNSFIEEQGASTSALGKLPDGVRSGVAIESVKATEYANLKIASDQLKNFMKRVSERMLTHASRFIDPQTVYLLDKGNPSYYDVVGEKGYLLRKQMGEDMSGTIPIRKDTRVQIEIESGLGFTMEGRKQTMQQIVGFMMPLVQAGMIPPEGVKILVQKLLETYQFGSVEDFMDVLDKSGGVGALNEQQTDQMKVALLETLKDAGAVGQESEQAMVDSTKVGVLEALKESGLLDKLSGPKEAAPKPPSESINYKDLPPEGKQQLAAKAGISIAPPVEPVMQGGANAINQG